MLYQPASNTLPPEGRMNKEHLQVFSGYPCEARQLTR
jgi:hypothetical protein